MTTRLVIGIGNHFRGDDAVGLVVAQRVRTTVPPGVTILEKSGEGTALMATWEDADHVVLVDAVQTGGVPGTIYHFVASEQPIPAQFRNNFSSHGFGAAEAIEMARLLGKVPERLVIFGIEAKSFAPGSRLSPEVEEAAQTVVEYVLVEINTR